MKLVWIVISTAPEIPQDIDFVLKHSTVWETEEEARAHAIDARDAWSRVAASAGWNPSPLDKTNGDLMVAIDREEEANFGGYKGPWAHVLVRKLKLFKDSEDYLGDKSPPPES